MNVLFLSHTHLGGTFVVGSHHLAKGLSKKGCRVLHISTPLTPIHFLKKNKETMYKQEIRKRNEEKNNLKNFVPFSLFFPWKISRHLYSLLNVNLFALLALREIKSKVKETFGEKVIDVILIDQPSFVGIERFIKAKKIIYRATDIYSNLLNDSIILKAEREIIKRCDGLIGTSSPVIKHITSYNNSLPYLLLENGVDLEHFTIKQNKPSEYEFIQDKIAVYVGAIDERFDTNSIIDLALARKDLKIVLIGPVKVDISVLKRYTNIEIIGARDYKTLPSYLQYADVALLPMINNKANNGRSPMKLYEYLAAGLPVVTLETEEIGRRKEKNVFLYNRKKKIDKAVEEALLNFQANKSMEYLNKHSWDSKTNMLIKFIEKL